MNAVLLSHEHSCNDVNYLNDVKRLLTRKDMDRFYKLCVEGVHVDSHEYELYVEYYETLVKGETLNVEVSIGMTSDEQDDEDEATGNGGCCTNVAQHFFYLFHQMSAYIAYLEHRSSQENAYFEEFMVSFWFF